MKLAEALTLRADLKKRMEQLNLRLQRNAKVQDGDLPAENPEALVVDFENTASEYLQIIARINLTNAGTAFGSHTLTDALAERDILRLRQALYRGLAQAATITQTINTRSEVRFRSTISVADTQKKADDLAQQLRKLDLRIQEENWSTTLL